MPTYRSTPRSRRNRTVPPVPEQQQQAFFQPKLTIGQPNDVYEREADAVADNVVSQGSRAVGAAQGQPAVQRMPISSVQRLSTPEEDKMPATNDGRMAEDKKIQEKPDLQRQDTPKEEEKPVQKVEGKEEERVQAMGEVGKEEEKPVQKAEAKEEEKPVQTMGEAGKEEEKPVQKAEAKEEEKPVQAMGEAGKEEEKPVQKAEVKEEEKPVQAMGEAGKEEEKPVQKAEAKEEEKPVQTKTAGAPTHTSPDFSARLTARRGKGEPLPRFVRAEMERGIGADFGGVRIHRDAEAVQLNREIHAQAFTRGTDVYFNSGKFDPGTTEGKRLLAHELTHVVQQGGAAPKLQKKDPVASTPVPEGYKTQKDEAGNVEQYSGVEAGVDVVILPDKRGEVPEDSSGATESNFEWETPAWESGANGKIKRLDGTPKVKVTIQTTYKPGADPSADSAYGRGTTAADTSAGKKSLRHHEGSHGTESIQYLRKIPVPKFKGKVGMTVEQYEKAVQDFNTAMQKYQQSFQDYTRDQVDCVGKPAGFCKK